MIEGIIILTLIGLSVGLLAYVIICIKSDSDEMHEELAKRVLHDIEQRHAERLALSRIKPYGDIDEPLLKSIQQLEAQRSEKP